MNEAWLCCGLPGEWGWVAVLLFCLVGKCGIVLKSNNRIFCGGGGVGLGGGWVEWGWVGYSCYVWLGSVAECSKPCII